ncbi:hypothetical protein BGW38_010034 [Lunasporangiospora selenospora]|uniref:Inhibitor I9 domain-containing protein n=1 Tax=Lunasporangiospora selenospora TaxID=979761 RepID=A0A9P6FYU6_9FUNG|nr:hypothetical protein BGW38_010034 [Lunasporangiospora selenospora]
MKFSAVVALLATVLTVSSAALPVEPKVTFDIDETQQHAVEGHTPFSASLKSYIVVFKDSAAALAIERIEKDILGLGGKIGHRYDSVLKGFSAWLPTPVFKALSTNPLISYIELDGTGAFLNFLTH